MHHVQSSSDGSICDVPGIAVGHATDERGVIKTCNPATTALFGYRAPELQEQKIDALFTDAPPDAERSGSLLDSSGRMRSTGKVALNLLGSRKDGTGFPVELTITEFNREGKRRFVAVSRDVSARQAADEALHRSEEMFRALVENAPDVIIRDVDGVMIVEVVESRRFFMRLNPLYHQMAMDLRSKSASL